MKEYTFLAVLSVFATVVFDRTDRVRILYRKDFYLFLFIFLNYLLTDF